MYISGEVGGGGVLLESYIPVTSGNGLFLSSCLYIVEPRKTFLIWK